MKILFAALVFFRVSLALASGEVAQSFTLDGRLYQAGSTTMPVLDTGSFRIQILGPSEIAPGVHCVLYEESRAFNTTTSNGYFSVKVGTALAAGERGAADSGNTMAQVFSNAGGAINGKESDDGTSNCSYNPSSGQGRLVRIHVTRSDASVRTLTPDLALDSVPSAIVAERAETLQGLSRAQVLELGAGQLTQQNVETVFSNTNYPRLSQLLSVPTTNYVQSGANGAAGLPQVAGNPGSGLVAGQFWYDSAGNVLKFYNGSAVQTLGVSGAGITSLTAGTGLTGGTITTAGQTIAVDVGTTVGKIVQVQTGGKLPALDGTDLTALSGTAIQAGTIGGSTSINTTGTVTAASSSVATSTLRTLEIFKSDNSAKVTITASGAQGANYGLVLPVDDGAVNQVLSTNGSGVLSWVNLSPTGAATGDLTDNYPNPTVAKIRGFGVATTTPQEGQVYRWNNTATEWQPVFFGIDDLRTSAGLAQFTATCTTANKTLTWSAVTDAFSCTDIAIAHTAVSGLGSAATKTAGTGAGHVLELDGSGKVPAATLGSTVVLDGGNATAAAMNVGTTGAQSLSLITNNTSKLTITSGGSVGIGTAAPSNPLHVSAVDGSAGLPLKSETTGADSLSGITLKNDAKTWQLRVDGGDADKFKVYDLTGTVTRVAIDSSGNTGVGLNNPVARLDVRSIASTPTHVAAGILNVASQDVQGAGLGGSITLGGYIDVAASNHRNFAAIQGLKENSTAGDGSGYMTFSTNLSGMNERMRISSNGNVGIGTTAPSSTLDVLGNAAVRGAAGNTDVNIVNAGTTSDYPLIWGKKSNGGSLTAMTATTTNDILFRVLASGHNGTSYAGRADISFRAAENTSGTGHGTYMTFGTTPIGSTDPNPTERLRITDSGRIGIGTNAPAVSLDLGTKTDALRLPNGTDGNRPGTPANGMIRYNTTSNRIEAYENGGWVNAIGGVSSSTSSVTATAGSAGAPSMSFSGDPNTGFFNAASNDTISVATGGAKVFDLSSAGLVSATTGGGLVTTANGTAGAPTFSFAGDPDTGWFRPAADSMAASTAGVERIRIGSTGNIGIGTTDPQYNLDLHAVGAGSTAPRMAVTGYTNGSSAAGAYLRLASSKAGAVGTLTTTNTGTLGVIDFMGVNANATPAWSPAARLMAGVDGAPTADHVPGALLFYTADGTTGSNERMRLTSTGSVGIGTTSPLTPLHVTGPLYAAQFPINAFLVDTAPFAANVGGGIGFGGYIQGDTTPIAFGGVRAGKENATSGNTLGYLSLMYRAAGTLSEGMRISSDGNVGVGTVAPAVKADVQFTGDDGLRVKNTGSDHASIYIDGGTGGGAGYVRFRKAGTDTFWVNTDTSNNLQFRPSAGTAMMTLLNGGNIAIGAATASTRVDITSAGSTAGEPTLSLRNPSTAAYSASSIESYAAGSWRSSFWSMRDNTGSGAVVGISSADSGGTARERLRITATGQMAVGTTAVGASRLSAADSGVNGSNLAIYGEFTGTSTANGSYYNKGVYGLQTKKVNAGVTDGGYGIALHGLSLRNSGTTADNGTLASVYGGWLQYGHFNSDVAATPQTTAAYGLLVQPYQMTGTITNMYDLYLATPGAGTAATNRWSMYQQDANSKNFFAGNVGIGSTATSPQNSLHISNASGDEGSPGIFIQDPTATAAYGGSVYFDDRGGLNVMKLSTTDNGTETGFVAIDRLSGNVGIGTATTAASLHLLKSDTTVYDAASTTWQQGLMPTLKVHNSANNNNASSQLILNNRTATERAVRFVNVGSSSGSQLAIVTTQGGTELPAERLRIDTDGEVGIGTATPAARLDVNGTTKLGAAGVAFAAAGACTLASFTAAAGANARTCTGIPAGAAVYCSPTATQGASNAWNVWASAADTVTINIENNGNASVWKCMWMNP